MTRSGVHASGSGAGGACSAEASGDAASGAPETGSFSGTIGVVSGSVISLVQIDGKR